MYVYTQHIRTLLLLVLAPTPLSASIKDICIIIFCIIKLYLPLFFFLFFFSLSLSHCCPESHHITHTTIRITSGHGALLPLRRTLAY